MATSIAVALVQSRLDYCNSLLTGISTFNLNKIQRVPNSIQFNPDIYWILLPTQLQMIGTLPLKSCSFNSTGFQSNLALNSKSPHSLSNFWLKIPPQTFNHFSYLMFLHVCWDLPTNYFDFNPAQELPLVVVPSACLHHTFGTPFDFLVLPHLHHSNEIWKHFIFLHRRH